MKKILVLTLNSFIFSLIVACVTVNVNFPEGAVQKAADDYVKELYKAKEKDEKSNKSGFNFYFSLLPVAHAQDFRVDSAKAKEIQSRQKSRLSDLTQHLKDGQIGENSNGLLEVKATDAKPILIKKIEKLVNDENADREALYEEIVKSNNLSSSVKNQVQSSFAKSFQGAAPKGSWVEPSPGKWEKK